MSADPANPKAIKHVVVTPPEDNLMTAKKAASLCCRVTPHVPGIDAEPRCVARYCMQWRWAGVAHYDDGTSERVGYCGMAGDPGPFRVRP